MLYRLREAYDIDSNKLKGVVEVDETYIGGKEKNKHSKKKSKSGSGAVGKAAIFGLRERGGKVKVMHIKSTDKESLQGDINKNVEKGSTVYTDDRI